MKRNIMYCYYYYYYYYYNCYVNKYKYAAIARYMRPFIVSYCAA